MTSTSIKLCLTTALLLSAAASGNVHAEPIKPLVEHIQGGTIIVPGSSQVTVNPHRVHTDYEVFLSDTGGRASSPDGKGETAASLACVYGLVQQASGCDPAVVTAVSTSGSRVIAIVDAYDDPNAMADLNTYSKQMGLPRVTSENFQIIYAAGSRPLQDFTGEWEVEESLDIEMAHALAPNAKIILVEAASATPDAMMAAELVAGQAVANAGGGEVSNSWGTSAVNASLALYGGYFNQSGVVYLASSGDRPGVEVPSVFPNVVSAGGTTIKRKKGVYQSQTVWNQTGGGLSDYIARPSYQDGVSNVVHSARGVPDVSADANPQTGPWVYDSIPFQGTTLNWVMVGGTSAAAPMWAAIINDSGRFAASSTDELGTIYAGLGSSSFVDVAKGLCLNAPNGKVRKGYDLCTGIGTPFGLGGE